MGWPLAYIYAISPRKHPYFTLSATTMTTLTKYWSLVAPSFALFTTARERPQPSFGTMVTSRPARWPSFVWPAKCYLWLLGKFSRRNALGGAVAATSLLSSTGEVSGDDGQESTVEDEHSGVATNFDAYVTTSEKAPNSTTRSRPLVVSTTPTSRHDGSHLESTTDAPTSSLPVGPQDSTEEDFDCSCASAADNLGGDTFYFGGLLVDTQLQTWADELARLDQTKQEARDDITGHSLSAQITCELDSDRSDSPASIFDGDDSAPLDLSDLSSWTSDGSDSESLPSFSSSVASSACSVYSTVFRQAAPSCTSIAWSGVCRSLASVESPGTSVAGLKDGNASDYVESPFVSGCEAEEPANLHHTGNTYFLRDERGKGTFGRVYMANDYYGNIRAIKVVHKDKQYRGEDGREILIQEKRALEIVARAKRPFLTPLLDSWADKENVYFVMVRHCTLLARASADSRS